MMNCELSDDDIRKLWREKGGSFHGPNVETGTMPETQLLLFLRELLVLPPRTIRVQTEVVEFGGGLDAYSPKLQRQACRLATAIRDDVLPPPKEPKVRKGRKAVATAPAPAAN